MAHPENINAVPSSEADWNAISDAVVVSERKPRQHWTVRLPLLLAVVLLVGLPLFYGGKNWLAISLAQTAIFSLLAALSIYVISSKNTAQVTYKLSNVARRLLVITSLFAVVVVLQLIPLPSALLELISPASHAAYSSVGVDAAPISLEVGTTVSQLTWFIAVVLFSVLLAILPEETLKTRLSPTPGRRRRSLSKNRLLERARKLDSVVDLLQRAIIAAGILCSLIALAHLSTGTGLLFGIFNAPWLNPNSGRAHWPFVNPNHLAVLIEIAIVTSYARLLRLTQLTALKGGRGETRKLSLRLLRSPEKLGLHVTQLLGIFIMLLGAVLTLSRAGICLVVLGLIVTWIGFQRYQFPQVEKSRPRERYPERMFERLFRRIKKPLGVVLVALVVLFFIGQTGREHLTKRLEYGLSFDRNEARIELFLSSLDVIKEFPVLGTGLGCWHLAAARHVPISLAGWKLDYAHNEYAQAFAEVGLVGAVLILSFLLVLAGATRRAWQRELLPSERILLLGSTMAISLPLMHSLVDFPFHIPALALMYGIALALHCRLVTSLGVNQDVS